MVNMNSYGLGMYVISVNEMFPPCPKVLFQKPWDVSGSHCTWNFKRIAFDFINLKLQVCASSYNSNKSTN
jgi:hypothetical protein